MERDEHFGWLGHGWFCPVGRQDQDKGWFLGSELVREGLD